MVQEVVIVAALRTPIGCFNGALAPLHAHEVLKTFQLFNIICYQCRLKCCKTQKRRYKPRKGLVSQTRAL